MAVRHIYALKHGNPVGSISWSIYGPVIVSECSLNASGSHPCRVFSVSYDQPRRCHGRGRGFESRRPRHSFQALATLTSSKSGDVRRR
jgi:hypothetical protein